MTFEPNQASLSSITVFRGHYTKPDKLFGPFLGFRQANVLCYEFELPKSFKPAVGKTNLERTFVLLDLGISFSNPIWFKDQEIDTWYVDLVHVEQNENTYTCLDLFIDAIVPTDGRSYRQLDFEEFAVAVDTKQLDWATASDGLQRWQTFLDSHLHQERFPTIHWSDFPPQAIKELQALPIPLVTSHNWSES